MGVYLNSKTAYTLYKSETEKNFFVDKSKILEELFPLVQTGNNHICITRPRRFGKTVTANMISAFFSDACDARDIFDPLLISQTVDYDKFLNQFPVIHISFNELGSRCSSYRDYIDRIENRLLRDFKREYRKLDLEGIDNAADALLELYSQDETARFIFVLDEWDFIFHQDFITEQDKKEYLMFLRNLLKDRPYVRLAYMTGILPIAKYSSGSELNMFSEFTMASEERFSEYFGFTDQEVDALFARYEKMGIESAQVTREGLKKWYDGYHTKGGERLYNPRSVVMSLSNNNLGNYWTSSGPYDEIFYYIKNNVDAVKDDLALMVSGQSIPAKIWEYAATSQELKTKEQIFSAMVVYGFLSYEDGEVFIPNKELMDQFSDMLKREESLGYVYRLAKASEKMLEATLRGDTETMEQILEETHEIETPILSYNHETELSAVVNLTYLAARDYYRVEREEKAGKGFVDFIFYPEMPSVKTGMILELKVNHSPEEAIDQIREKNYLVRFTGKKAKNEKKIERILLVGIGYDKQTKKHRCKIEEQKLV
ncbi:AAA family ATPase [Parablautia sp. Marseille-Q6255]|uniref:AAA family ATPase n=1 Tax=Parablautia sp. Marseille-Q6255 TaxID=3039593 RepID=UPI0024BD491C|nr:AAA family ATPase [Parablautia sp. Marseille-Q6255]